MVAFRSSRWSKAVLLTASLVLTSAIAPSEFENDVLMAHNAERTALGLRPLAWNADLAAGARRWSEHLASTGRFEHSPSFAGEKPVGENIWGGTPGTFRPERMVAAWISEKKHFKPGVFPMNSTTGRVEDVSHYTQIIWSSSRQVGCAISRGASEEILVCRYSTPGNVIGTSPL